MRLRNNIAVSDTGFLFNPTTGESYNVNPLGTEIINLMKEGKSNADITKILADKYQIEEPTIEKDLMDFHNMLVQYNLIEE